MNRAQIASTAVVAVTSAFLGGLLSSHFFTRPALAEVPSRRILAREFRLVDYEGRTRALLNFDTTEKELEPTLTLFAQDEEPKIKFVVDREGNASAHFWAKEAHKSSLRRLEIYPSINFWGIDNERLNYSLPYK